MLLAIIHNISSTLTGQREEYFSLLQSFLFLLLVSKFSDHHISDSRFIYINRNIVICPSVVHIAQVQYTIYMQQYNALKKIADHCNNTSYKISLLQYRSKTNREYRKDQIILDG
jgi:hypothetical protein